MQLNVQSIATYISDSHPVSRSLLCYGIVCGSMCTIRLSCRRLSHVWPVVKLKWLKWFKSNLFVKMSAFLLLSLLTVLDTLCDGPFNFDRNNSLSSLEQCCRLARNPLRVWAREFTIRNAFSQLNRKPEKMKRVQKMARNVNMQCVHRSAWNVTETDWWCWPKAASIEHYFYFIAFEMTFSARQLFSLVPLWQTNFVHASVRVCTFAIQSNWKANCLKMKTFSSMSCAQSINGYV